MVEGGGGGACILIWSRIAHLTGGEGSDGDDFALHVSCDAATKCERHAGVALKPICTVRAMRVPAWHASPVLLQTEHCEPNDNCGAIHFICTPHNKAHLNKPCKQDCTTK